MTNRIKIEVNGKTYETEVDTQTLLSLVPELNNTGYERAEYNEKFYFMSAADGVCPYIEMLDTECETIYLNANYYSDKTLAENNARADKLMRKLRRFAVEKRTKDISWNPHNVSDKYYIYYNHNTTSLDVYTSNLCQTFGTIYFDDEYTARLAIDRFRDELLWYFIEYKDTRI